MMITAGLASGLVWLSIVPTQHLNVANIWPALAISVAMVALGAYMHVAPDYLRLPLPGRKSAQSTGRRHSPAFREHVNDLRDFALRCEGTLFVNVQGGGAAPFNHSVDIARPSGQSLRAHYPHVADEVDAWNVFVKRLDKAEIAWKKFQYAEADRLFPQGAWDQSLTGLMESIAKGITPVETLEWYVNSQRISVDGEPRPSWWALGKVPQDGDTLCRTLTLLWRMLSTLHDSAVATEWRYVHAEVGTRRTAVLDALERAATHGTLAESATPVPTPKGLRNDQA